jgi:translation initiation factor IF-3
VADFKQNYFQRRTKDRGPKSNNRISSPEVQVIGSDGGNLGILNTNEAISIAKEQGLDLIEISPNAKPPVCKIIDMGKFKYDAQKKANVAKKKTENSFIKRN